MIVLGSAETQTLGFRLENVQSAARSALGAYDDKLYRREAPSTPALAGTAFHFLRSTEFISIYRDSQALVSRLRCLRIPIGQQFMAN
jgi:hypothetical protein